MKNKRIVFLTVVLICLAFLFVACDSTAKEIRSAEEQLDNQLANDIYDTAPDEEDTGVAVASADFGEGWELVNKDVEFESEVDGLLPTEDKYFYFEPYSTIGYKVRGFNPNITTGRPTEIVIPNTYKGLPVVMIDTGSFRGDETLKSVKMGSNMRYVYANAFRDCANLETIELGVNVKKIHHAAFRNCYKLKSVAIPAKVTRLEAAVFANCKSLESVTMSQYYYSYTDAKGKTQTAVYAVCDIAVNVFTGCESLKTITLPKTLTGIGSGAFRNSGLEGTLTLTAIQSIGTLAFSNCSNLEITYNKRYKSGSSYSDTVLGTNPFNGCKKVTAR